MNHLDRLDEDAVRDLMEKILAEIPEIGWELGPDLMNRDRTVLALSSNGSWEVIKHLSKQLGLPIRDVNWDIVAGIPPREWDRYFELETDDGEKFLVECSGWRWALIRRDLVAEIILVLPENLRDIGSIEREAISIFMCGELGEQNYYERVRIVEILHFSDQSLRYELMPIDRLRLSFSAWFPDAPYAEFFALQKQ